MKFREIFRFEFLYQARLVRTWIYFAVLLVVAFLFMSDSIEGARGGGEFANSPYAIAVRNVLSSLLWLLMAPAVAGSAAARDVQTRMYPLVYTTPISKAEYLAGRFLAALVLNALILLTAPAGILLAPLVLGDAPEILGPFRPSAHISAYTLIVLPTACVATAVQFSCAALRGRAIASYLGSVFLFIYGFFVPAVVAEVLEMRTLGRMLDPTGFNTVVGILSRTWTPTEKNTIVVGLTSSMLANRVLWVGIALAVLAFTYLRFRVDHEHRISERGALRDDVMRSAKISTSQLRRTAGYGRQAFGFATYGRQTCGIAWTSFGTIAKSFGGLPLLAAIALFVAVFSPVLLHVAEVPVLTTTAQVASLLAAPIAAVPSTPWAFVPLLIIFYAGEIVWRERDAGLSELVDATPVPEWVFFLGKFLGLSLVLVVWMAFLTTAGMLVQLRLGYFDFEIGLYLKILFGLQLVDYILFALLIFVVHTVVNQKHLGYLVALIAYGVIVFPSGLGIEHDLLIYGSDPGWSYTDLRGFSATLTPWLWFKSYWAAWALLLAVAARLLWARGREYGIVARIRMARLRLTPATARVAAVAAALVLALGGFIFYTTNVVTTYQTASDRLEQSAEYERRYGQYESIPQPWLTGARLHVEIHPKRRAVEIRGTYTLENRSSVPVDKIHLATSSEVDTRAVTFDRPAALVVGDEILGYRMYALEQPLQPGDSVQLSFDVHHEPRGFRSSGVDASVAADGTYFTSRDWLPAIGYQRNRELRDVGARKRHGLPPRAALSSLHAADARGRRVDRVAFEATVGTEEGQIAVAPGTLRRTWTESGRRYFHYATDVPILNDYDFYSASYAIHEARWGPSVTSGQSVAIRIYHHPRHTANLSRMVRGIRAALDYFTQQFGPYPHHHLTVVERGSHGDALSAKASVIDYGERFALLNPREAPPELDIVFFGMAHEVAHQWWGWQVRPASVEGEVLMAEGLANYSAMQLLEKTYGHEHLERYLNQVLRASYQIPRTRAAVPLLRADNAFLGYRKGAHAMYALSRYIGEERVNGALRRLFEKHSSATPPLPTSLDLYRELRAVTPASFQSLLHDLFEVNTFWELETEGAIAVQNPAGSWQVTLDVRAHKEVVDEAGVETELPLDDWVEIGVFAPATDGHASGEPIYLQKHRITTSGEQTITVTVPYEPARAGIDPNNLLIDWQTDDNVKAVTVE